MEPFRAKVVVSLSKGFVAILTAPTDRKITQKNTIVLGVVLMVTFGSFGFYNGMRLKARPSLDCVADELCHEAGRIMDGSIGSGLVDGHGDHENQIVDLEEPHHHPHHHHRHENWVVDLEEPHHHPHHHDRRHDRHHGLKTEAVSHPPLHSKRVLWRSPLMVIYTDPNMKTVINTRSVEYMPFLLSFFLFLNGGIWTAYVILAKDIFLFIPNGIGFFLGSIQYTCAT